MAFILVQHLQGMTGTSLVAGSPIRHNPTLGHPVELQTYQPPWKTLSEFALQSDLDQPVFQQLVSEKRNAQIGDTRFFDAHSTAQNAGYYKILLDNAV